MKKTRVALRRRGHCATNPLEGGRTRGRGGRLRGRPVDVELAPNERLVMRTAEGPFPMETTSTWAPAGEGKTRMTLRNRGEPSGFSKVVAPLMARAMRRATLNDLARLKALLERS